MSQTHALVIDDNPFNLKVLVQLLNKQGAACTEVSHPSQLQQVVAALDNVDVVFLDLEMPGMDGYETHAWLRDRLKGVPIIAYTVHVSEMNVVKQRGFDGFLGKPLDNERFPGQLSRILAHEPVWERA